EVNGSFPMGRGNPTMGPNGNPAPLAKQGLSALAAILPQLGETPTYNAINFSFGMADNTSYPAFQVNQTAQKAQIKCFLCPSDPNAFVSLDTSTATGNNSYYASIGATTDTYGNAGDRARTGPRSRTRGCSPTSRPRRSATRSTGRPNRSPSPRR